MGLAPVRFCLVDELSVDFGGRFNQFVFLELLRVEVMVVVDQGVNWVGHVVLDLLERVMRTFSFLWVANEQINVQKHAINICASSHHHSFVSVNAHKRPFSHECAYIFSISFVELVEMVHIFLFANFDFDICAADSFGTSIMIQREFPINPSRIV